MPDVSTFLLSNKAIGSAFINFPQAHALASRSDLKIVLWKAAWHMADVIRFDFSQFFIASAQGNSIS
jgi:hypothetical protein